MKEQIKLKPVSRNSIGMMEALWDELNNLREGKTTIARANVVVKMTQQICLLARLHHEGVSIDPKKLLPTETK